LVLDKHPIVSESKANLSGGMCVRQRSSRKGRIGSGLQLRIPVHQWRPTAASKSAILLVSISIPALVTQAQQSEIANKDAGCNAVTDSGAVFAFRP
jgi:hypothetical protein